MSSFISSSSASPVFPAFFSFLSSLLFCALPMDDEAGCWPTLGLFSGASTADSEDVRSSGSFSFPSSLRFFRAFCWWILSSLLGLGSSFFSSPLCFFIVFLAFSCFSIFVFSAFTSFIFRSCSYLHTPSSPSRFLFSSSSSNASSSSSFTCFSLLCLLAILSRSSFCFLAFPYLSFGIWILDFGRRKIYHVFGPCIR